MISDVMEGTSWLLIGSTTGIALVVLFLFARFWKGSDEGAPPVAPTGILETIKGFSGPEAPSFVLAMTQKTNSLIYKTNLPIPGGAYLIGDSAAQREIFVDSTTDKPGAIYMPFSKIGGYANIFTRITADPHWKAARKGSAPAFSSKEVNRMNRICTEHLERWIESSLQPLVDKNESFDPDYQMVSLTFRIVMESAFEYVPTDEEYKEFVYHLEIALREFTFKQSVNPLRRTFGFLIPEVRGAIQSCLVVRRFAQKILDNYRASPYKSPQNTLIKLLDENKNFANDCVKVSELVTYITAGFETTGHTLATALVLLAKHPDVCKKARESLKGLPPSKPSDYLRYVIAESNRLVPVAAMGSIREAGRDFTFAAGLDKQRAVHIPKGAVLFMPQIVPNRDPAVYPNPEAFRPERWSQASKAMQEGLLTFALGNRNCIGQSLAMAEINSVLPRLLSDYSFELEEEGKLDYFLTLKFRGSRLKAYRVAD